MISMAKFTTIKNTYPETLKQLNSISDYKHKSLKKDRVLKDIQELDRLVAKLNDIDFESMQLQGEIKSLSEHITNEIEKLND